MARNAKASPRKIPTCSFFQRMLRRALLSAGRRTRSFYHGRRTHSENHGEQGLCSRRAAEQIIAEGRVKVNGHPVKVGDKMDPNRDVLHVDDERIYIQKNQQMYYLALYKPRGYVTTASDELGRKTVMELVSRHPGPPVPRGPPRQGQRGPAADDQ